MAGTEGKPEKSANDELIKDDKSELELVPSPRGTVRGKGKAEAKPKAKSKAKAKAEPKDKSKAKPRGKAKSKRKTGIEAMEEIAEATEVAKTKVDADIDKLNINNKKHHSRLDPYLDEIVRRLKLGVSVTYLAAQCNISRKGMNDFLKMNNISLKDFDPTLEKIVK